MKQTSLILLLLLIAFSGLAQAGDVTVDNVVLPEITWGEKSAGITITNSAPYAKYVVIITEAEISNKNTLSRTIRTNYFIGPEKTVEVSQKLIIPGSFGGGVIHFKFYDVIDTLDAILDYQLFDSKNYDFTFSLPEKLKPYVENPIFFPPRVNEHPYFNDDFTRIMLALCAEGKTITEINLLTETDVAFIIEVANRLVDKHMLKKGNNIYELDFPFIKNDEAQKVYSLAQKISDQLAGTIETNMAGYWTKVDSLIESKIIPRDSNDFLSGATLIFKPHAMVSVMLMWYKLGGQFITRSAPLKIYDGTDICNADIYQYMYAVNAAPQYYNEQFFYLSMGPNSYAMTYSRKTPDITCTGDYLISKAKGDKPRWRYTHPIYPEFFIVDTVTAEPIIDMLKQGTDKIIYDAYNELKAINKDFGHNKADFGYRYWFWSLASELALQKLEDKGVINKPENVYYRFDSIKK